MGQRRRRELPSSDRRSRSWRRPATGSCSSARPTCHPSESSGCTIKSNCRPRAPIRAVRAPTTGDTVEMWLTTQLRFECILNEIVLQLHLAAFIYLFIFEILFWRLQERRRRFAQVRRSFGVEDQQESASLSPTGRGLSGNYHTIN